MKNDGNNVFMKGLIIFFFRYLYYMFIVKQKISITGFGGWNQLLEELQ